MTGAAKLIRKHLFGDSYQGYELPGGVYVPGADYAPDPRRVWELQKSHSPSEWAGLHVLDLAGNNGYHAIRALREGASSAILAEQSASAAAKALDVAKKWGVDLTVVVGDIEKVNWHDHGPFDVIFCHQVLYHLVEPIKLLRRAREALILGGRFLAYTRIAINVHEKHWEWVPNADTMRRTLYYVGFTGVNIDGESVDVRAVEYPATQTLPGQCKVLVTACV